MTQQIPYWKRYRANPENRKRYNAYMRVLLAKKREENREAYNEYYRKYYAKNREKILAYQHERYLQSKQK